MEDTTPRLTGVTFGESCIYSHNLMFFPVELEKHEKEGALLEYFGKECRRLLTKAGLDNVISFDEMVGIVAGYCERRWNHYKCKDHYSSFDSWHLYVPIDKSYLEWAFNQPADEPVFVESKE